MKYAAISASSSGSNTVVAAVTGKRIRVLSYVMVAAGDVTATWKSASNNISGGMALAANGGAAPSAGQATPGGLIGQFETNQGEALNLNLSAAVSVAGHLTYIVTD
jgi:hypothetical protein